MELERSKKKKKYSKPRELSPPPPVLTLDELEERFTDANERQPSTSRIGSKGTREEIENDETSTNEENAAKSVEKLDDHQISTPKSSIDSKENETKKFVFPDVCYYLRRHHLTVC